MFYNYHYFVIELNYSYISISVVRKYPDVSIPESKFVRMCSKHNL